jgi:hypothetical protein
MHPKPRHGENYFQWMNEQYGLKKLIEHIWKVVGIASTNPKEPRLGRHRDGFSKTEVNENGR